MTRPASPSGLDFPAYWFPVELGKCLAFAQALGPLPQSAEGHQTLPAAEIAMPPTLPVCSHIYSPSGVPPIVSLADAGVVDRGRILQAGIEFEWHRPIAAGERLRVHDRLLSTEDKVGSRGALRVFTFVSEFWDPEGVLTMTIRTTNIERAHVDRG